MIHFRTSQVVLVVKNPPAAADRLRDAGLIPGSGGSPGGGHGNSTPVFLPAESHGQRNLVGYCSWGHKGLDMTEVTAGTQNSFDMGASSDQEMFVSKEIQIPGIIHYHISPISIKFALLSFVR